MNKSIQISFQKKNNNKKISFKILERLKVSWSKRGSKDRDIKNIRRKEGKKSTYQSIN